MKRKPIRWFLYGILGCLTMAIGAYFWANALMDSALAYRSPLAQRPPEPGAAPEIQRLARRVVIVLVDALRYDTSRQIEVMPFLHELRGRGAQAMMTSRPPSFSAPAWTVLLTGAWADINDGQPFNPPDDWSVRPFTQDDLFAAAERAGLKAAVSGYFWFKQMLAGRGVDAEFYTPGEDAAADRAVVDAALPWLDSGEYALVLIHLDQVDYAGHYEGGPRDPRWNEATARVDALLAEIAARLDLNRDALLIVSDHGHIDRGGHGGPEAVVLHVPFVLVGPGVRSGYYSDVEMVDVAPTVAVLLALNLPASSQGRPLTEMLTLSTEDIARIRAAEAAQKERLLRAYETAIGSRSALQPSADEPASYVAAIEDARLGRLGRERVWRNMLAVFVAILPPYLLYVRRERGALPLLIGALVYLVLFHFRYAILDERTYSLSSVESQEWLIPYVSLTATLALVIGWLLAMLLSRAFVQGARRAANLALGYIWLVLYLLVLPISVSFAVNGALITWTLPEFYTMYLALLSLIQAIVVAALGLVLTALSAGIGKLIHVQRR